MMKCPNCGIETEGNEKFCTGCGIKLDNPLAEEGANIPKAPEPVQPPVQEPPKPQPYVNPAATVAPAVAAKKEKKKRDMTPCKPLSTWSYIWRSIVFCIPVIGIIVMFVMAFAKGVNENSKSYARAWLIFLLIAVIILIICAVLCYIFREPLLDWLGTTIRNFIGE